MTGQRMTEWRVTGRFVGSLNNNSWDEASFCIVPIPWRRSSQLSPVLVPRSSQILFLDAHCHDDEEDRHAKSGTWRLVHASKATAHRAEVSILSALPNPRAMSQEHNIYLCFKVLHLIPGFEIWAQCTLLHLHGGVGARICQCLDVSCQLRRKAAVGLPRFQT
jgi:hypothetical protein